MAPLTVTTAWNLWGWGWGQMRLKGCYCDASWGYPCAMPAHCPRQQPPTLPPPAAPGAALLACRACAPRQVPSTCPLPPLARR